MSTSEYFRAVFVEHPPLRHAVELTASVGVGLTSPWWLTALQEFNIILASFTGLCSAVIAGHAVYRLWRHYSDK